MLFTLDWAQALECLQGFLQTVFLLAFCHYLAEFPLQGQFLADRKDQTKNSAYVWSIALFAHCMIHAGFVFLVTKSVLLANFMLLSHFLIDWTHSAGKLGQESDKAFAKDQMLHLGDILVISLLYALRNSQA